MFSEEKSGFKKSTPGKQFSWPYSSEDRPARGWQVYKRSSNTPNQNLSPSITRSYKKKTLGGFLLWIKVLVQQKRFCNKAVRVRVGPGRSVKIIRQRKGRILLSYSERP